MALPTCSIEGCRARASVARRPAPPVKDGIEIDADGQAWARFKPGGALKWYCGRHAPAVLIEVTKEKR